MKRLLPLLSAASVLVLFVAAPSLAGAAAGQGQGIAVTPAINQITLTPNQTTASFNEQIINNTTSAVTLGAAAQDFTTYDLKGGIKFLPTQSQTATPHGLAQNITFGLKQLVLGPGQSQTIPVTIHDTQQLAAGGHYAALNFQVANVPSAASGNKVVINETVASLIFLTTAGRGTQTTTLDTPVLGHTITTLPQAINLVVTDSGNTQTTVRGYAQIVGPDHKVRSQGIINVNSGLILPGSARLFDVSLVAAKTKFDFAPGRYQLQVFFRHDGQAAYSQYNQRFLYVSRAFIAVLVLAVITVAWLVYLLRKGLIRRYLTLRPKRAP